jgi:hypothetical protein
MIWRGIAGGSVFGLLLGAIYGAILAVYSLASDSYLFGTRSNDFLIGNILIIGVGGFVGGLAGLGLGLCLGFVGGAILGTLTRLFFYSKITSTGYITFVRVAGMLFGIIGAPLGVIGFEILRSQSFRRPWTLSITPVYHIVPALIAGFAAMFIGGRIAHWYENEMRKQAS